MEGGIRVLYVDDEPHLLEITKIFLETSGEFKVDTSISVHEALDTFSVRSYDAIVSDYQMTEIDGIAFLKIVRDRFGDIPFILFTGRGREEVVIAAINHGADFYLQKGGDPKAQFAELAHKIRQAVLKKRAERSLRESEEKYRMFVEHNRDGVFIVQEGRLIFYNHAFAGLSGYTSEELDGRPLADLIAPEDREMVVSRAREHAEGVPVPERLEFSLLHKDGVHRTRMRVSAFPGKYLGRPASFGTFYDITKDRISEETLKETEEKFRALVETSRDIVWEIDRQGIFRYVSPRVHTITGYTPEDLIGRSLLDFVTEPKRSALIEDLKRYGSLKGSQIPIEVHIRHRDGSDIIVEIRPAQACSVGNREGFRGIAVDITERRRAEDALRNSEEKYRTFVETSPDMIWEIDSQGIFQYISPQSQSIMGYRPEELVGQSVIDLVPAELKAHFTRKLESLFSVEGSITPFEAPTNHRDGHPIIFEIRPALTASTGRREGFRGVAVDVTERKKAEQALKDANRQLKLLGGITRHDILNKVTLIRGYLGLMGKGIRDPSEAGHLEKIKSALSAIQAQIEFTRVYENLGTKSPRWHALALAMPGAHVPASITLDADVRGVEVYSDLMLERVFFNLLDNSIRHGQRVSRIQVSSYPDGTDLVVVWEDDGVGIPADKKEKIFERGFGENTGLGLFLVREILSLTGITIKETGEPGKGARFEIVVPDGGFRCSDRQPSCPPGVQ